MPPIRATAATSTVRLKKHRQYEAGNEAGDVAWAATPKTEVSVISARRMIMLIEGGMRMPSLPPAARCL